MKDQNFPSLASLRKTFNRVAGPSGNFGRQIDPQREKQWELFQKAYELGFKAGRRN